jgi:hypothetical protein
MRTGPRGSQEPVPFRQFDPMPGPPRPRTAGIRLRLSGPRGAHSPRPAAETVTSAEGNPA